MPSSRLEHDLVEAAQAAAHRASTPQVTYLVRLDGPTRTVFGWVLGRRRCRPAAVEADDAVALADAAQALTTAAGDTGAKARAAVLVHVHGPVTATVTVLTAAQAAEYVVHDDVDQQGARTVRPRPGYAGICADQRAPVAAIAGGDAPFTVRAT